jgi:hypothetical protein
MHLPINVKSPNNISKWQMGFNTAFKGLMKFTWPWSQTARQSLPISVQYLHIATCITSPSEGHCSVNCVLSFVQQECFISHNCVTSYHNSVAAFITPRKFLNQPESISLIFVPCILRFSLYCQQMHSLFSTDSTKQNYTITL